MVDGTKHSPRTRPIYTSINGIEVVTIPMSDYVELLDCRRRLGEITINHDQLFRPRRSMIERNPDVALFLAQNFGMKPVRVILQDCRRRFGRKRTPSLKSAYRYWERVRKEALKVI